MLRRRAAADRRIDDAALYAADVGSVEAAFGAQLGSCGIDIDGFSVRRHGILVTNKVAQSVAAIEPQREAGIEEGEKALAQIEAWRDQSQQHKNEAIAIENMLGKVFLPAGEDLEALKHLEHQLQLARARVGVGLHLGVRPNRELRLSIRRDEGELERSVITDGLFEATAKGEIRLDIEDIAEISVSGGEDSAREEVARLQMRWIAEAEPVLKQASLESLDDVVVAVNARAQRLEQIRELRQAAAALDQRVLDQRDWVSLGAERQRDLAASDDFLIGKDREELERVALKLGANDPAAVVEPRLRREHNSRLDG